MMAIDWQYLGAATSVGRELTPGELVRVRAGRHDWQDDHWEDECGVAGCGHNCCEVYRGEREPTRI